MGVLGGFKNMLRQWRKNRKRIQLEKKQKRLEEKKKKQKQVEKQKIEGQIRQYSKAEIIGKVTLGLCMGVLEVALQNHLKESKKEIKSVPRIAKELPTLEKKLDMMNKTISPTTLPTITRELKEIEQKISVLKNAQNSGDTLLPNSLIAKIDEKAKLVDKAIQEELKELPKETRKQIESDSKNKIEHLILTVTPVITHTKNQETTTPSMDDSTFITKGVGVEVNKKEIGDREKVFNFINTSTKKIKTTLKSIKETKEKIKTVQEYSHFYDMEYKINLLKNKMLELHDLYREMSGNAFFSELSIISNIEIIDIYNLRHSESEIKRTIKQCDDTLSEIDKRRKEIFYAQKEEKKQEEKKSEKKVSKEKPKEKIVDSSLLLDIRRANQMIEMHMNRELKQIIDLQTSIQTIEITKRKRPILQNLFLFTKNIFSIMFDMIPFTIFKNKFLGGLTSAIMVNHSLQNMRKAMKPDFQIQYHVVHEIDAQKEEIMDEFFRVTTDSKDQIAKLRAEIQKNYGEELENQEVISLLKELDGIEGQIISQEKDMLEKEQRIEGQIQKVIKMD